MIARLPLVSSTSTTSAFIHPLLIRATRRDTACFLGVPERRWLFTNTGDTQQQQQQQHVRLEHRLCSNTKSNLNINKQNTINNSDNNKDIDDNVIISILTLNRPKQANAMGSLMLRQLQQSIEELEQHHANQHFEYPPNDNDNGVLSSFRLSRCLVLTSCSLKVFSAGADLKERAEMTTLEEASVFVTSLRHTMNRLARLPMPVIAAIEGVAVGGGLELALAADLRIAGSQASFGLPETSLAIVPGAGGTQRLSRLIGVARAKELIFTGRRIPVDTAFQYGLVQHVVGVGRAEEKAIEMAREIAKNGPLAIRAAKAAIDEGLEASNMEDAMAVERHYYDSTLCTLDRLEGLAAFQESRQPTYKGE